MSGGLAMMPPPMGVKPKPGMRVPREDSMDKNAAFLDEMDDMAPMGGEVPPMDDIEDMAETETANDGPDLSAIPDEVLEAEIAKRKGGNPLTGKPPAQPGMMPPQGVMPPMEGPGSM